jgi:acyl-ACP thioesterase
MKSSTKKPEWHTEHLIRSYDVNMQSTARLPVLCRFMQEAAYHHAEHLGLGHSFLASKNMAWVLSRQRIVIKRLPRWGDAVKMRTWPSGRDRLFFYRDFEITDEDGAILLQASSAWFVIDTEKRERIGSEFYLNTDLPETRPSVFDKKQGRLKSCGCDSGEPVVVNYGDLDMNSHVNNVRYIEWIMNSLTLEFHQTHTIQSLEVNFLAEAMYGHEISICFRENSDSLSLDHGILADGTELFRGRSVWKTA